MSSIKNYMQSICSTCMQAAYCSLTKDKNSIHTCSEYFHFLDITKETVLMISNEMSSSESNKKLVLN